MTRHDASAETVVAEPRYIEDSEGAGEADFVRRFSRLVAAQVRRQGINANDVPDICQEVLWAAIHQLRAARFDGRAAVTTWLFRITRNKVTDHRRRASRRPVTESRRLDSTPLKWTQQELAVLMDEILDAMTPSHALIFRRCFLQGQAPKDVAPIVQLSLSRVLAILSKTKRAVTLAINDGKD
jgi:RNA polymerase sigma factor (sigma-70 family)